MRVGFVISAVFLVYWWINSEENGSDLETVLATKQVKPSEGAFENGDKTKLDGIATSANNYVHPTNAGNKHIPAGGASGNFLKLNMMSKNYILF